MRGKQLLFLVFFAPFHSCNNLPTPTLEPIDQFTQAPVVKNVTPGAVVNLWMRNASGGPALVVTSPPAAATVVRVPLPHRLSPGQIVQAQTRQRWFGFPWFGSISGLSNPVVVENNYVTNRYDNERSGWNPNESILTVNNVRDNIWNVFTNICEHQVKGKGAIRAQPLYVQDVNMGAKGTHNVIFVATDYEYVYAYDADSTVDTDPLCDGSAPTPSLWNRQLVTPPDESDVTLPCAGEKSKIGIYSTPVIDRATNTMYVVVKLQSGGNQFFRLHAIDITTGQDRATVNLDGAHVKFNTGTTAVPFSPDVQLNRPALLLDRGVVYLAFGGLCYDDAGHHGWVVAYDANLPESPSFLSQLGVFNTSPTESAQWQGAGVWQSGLGLAADGDGTVYLMTANGPFDAQIGNYGNTLLHLRLPPTNSATKEMQLIDFFTPFDWNDYNLNPFDSELGSGGPVLFKNGNKRFVLAGGKHPKSYLIDRDCTNCSGNPTGRTSDDTNLVRETITQLGGSVAGAAYYTGSSGTQIYYGANFSPISARKFLANATTPPFFANPTITLDSARCTAPIPTVSSNGNAQGSGILWAIFHPRPGNCGSGQPSDPVNLTLHAYDADDVATNLLPLEAGKDIGVWKPVLPTDPVIAQHSGNSFQVPTVIHGKVYCGTQDRLVVFGLQRRRFPVCSLVSDDGGPVIFHCTSDPGSGALYLERKQGGVWKSVTDSNSRRDLPDFVSLWDYPTGDTATYRVCSKDNSVCTPERSVKVFRVRPGTSGDLACGRIGKPPCSLYKSWPVSPGEKSGKTRPGKR